MQLRPHHRYHGMTARATLAGGWDTTSRVAPANTAAVGRCLRVVLRHERIGGEVRGKALQEHVPADRVLFGDIAAGKVRPLDWCRTTGCRPRSPRNGRSPASPWKCCHRNDRYHFRNAVRESLRVGQGQRAATRARRAPRRPACRVDCRRFPIRLGCRRRLPTYRGGTVQSRERVPSCWFPTCSLWAKRLPTPAAGRRCRTLAQPLPLSTSARP